MSKRLRVLLVSAAGLAVVAAAGLWLRAQEWPKNQRLSREGVPGRAVVTAKGLGDPRSVHYTYEAEGTLHSGVGRAGFGTPDFEQLEVDDEVLVFWAKSDPDYSTLGDPREHLRSNNRVLAALMTLAAPLLIGSLLRELKRQAV